MIKKRVRDAVSIPDVYGISTETILYMNEPLPAPVSYLRLRVRLRDLVHDVPHLLTSSAKLGDLYQIGGVDNGMGRWMF